MCRRVATFVGMALPGLLILIAGAVGQPRDVEPSQEKPKEAVKQPAKTGVYNKVVEQSFPPNGVMETAWKVEWDTEIGFGLVIRNAWFKKSPTAEWMQVLGDARVGDLFVPYQPGTPRFWDTAYNFKLSIVSAADAGPTGKLHVSNNGGSDDPCVVQELRDRGVIWKNNNGVRRGHVMVLWGTLHGYNYRYLMEYGFQDDGCVVFRVGAGGRNLENKEWLPHMHNYYWRVDINLDGKDHNTAYQMELTEPKEDRYPLASVTSHKLFNDGKAGWADWDAAKFTCLRIVNTQKKNIRGENIAYDLMPLRAGTSRHFGVNEECTQHDFWVTKADPKQLRYRDVPKYCSNKEDIVDTDIVLWYGTSMFHEPRSEDGIMEDGVWVGTTPIAWSGFTLKPNNVFDRSPLYPNPKDPVQPKRKGKGG